MVTIDTEDMTQDIMGLMGKYPQGNIKQKYNNAKKLYLKDVEEILNSYENENIRSFTIMMGNLK